MTLTIGDRGGEQEGCALEPGEEASLAGIFALIRERTGHNLSAYKQGPLLCGFERRMAAEGHTTFSGYLNYLQAHSPATQLLVRDLLVSVTSFFRDPQSWEQLKSNVLSPLVQAATSDSPIRIWVIACSTGEEAYSLAISLDEEFERHRAQRNYEIYASDCHSHVLDKARAGSYTPNAVTMLDATRLKRYFRARNGRYEIDQDIRNRVTFAEHNVLRDVPLAGLNLISCRNMLMFMRPRTQHHLGHVFQHALLSGGYLFLGDCEKVAPDLFDSVDYSSSIYSLAGMDRGSVPPGRSEIPEDAYRSMSAQLERNRHEIASLRQELRALHGELASRGKAR